MEIARLVCSGIIVAAVAAVATPCAAKAPDSTWHAAQTASEVALDRILKQADGDGDQLDNLLDGRGRPGFRPTVDYTATLTPPLLAAIKQTEKQLVQKSCHGHYTDEICGLDFSPLTCAQDVNDTYLYRTNFDGGHIVEISYAWASDKPAPAATYRLIEAGGTWKLDGIKCQDYTWNYPLRRAR
jgi:hypothetical protein